ncbi:MAG: O-methyltransferase [Anaerolineae bacterium]|nr:O-methyltransferase [Anaerolineae bacterium]
MFHNIPQNMLKRMRYLEEIDTRDRQDGTAHLKRLRQIPAETGRFLALMAAGGENGRYLEIGTSAGYSTMWLSLAGKPLTTYEVLPEKVAIAQETFAQAGIDHLVTLIHGDARDHLTNDYQTSPDIAFCFLDAEKEVYEACYDLLVPRLVSSGLLIADNATSHQDALRPFLERVLADERVDALVVPIGKGELVVRKI